MQEDNFVIGSVVFSRMGRDKGNYFMVVARQDDYVLICDGHSRKLGKPKKKNVKHVKFSGTVLQAIADKLSQNKKVFDSELRSALRQFNQVSEND